MPGFQSFYFITSYIHVLWLRIQIEVIFPMIAPSPVYESTRLGGGGLIISYTIYGTLICR